MTGGDEADARWSEVLPRLCRRRTLFVEADRSRRRTTTTWPKAGAWPSTTSPATARCSVSATATARGTKLEVVGHDVLTGAAKGRLRDDVRALRFVEVVVNGPKSWSLAAALHPDVAIAYDAAMDRAAGEVIGWVADHATTRVGSRGRQVQVPVEMDGDL